MLKICFSRLKLPKRLLFRLIILLIASYSLSSCSLLKIESAQTPLAKVDLNTRILTQSFATEAMDRVENAADSIGILEFDNMDVQINTLRWKIYTSKELGRLSFQTEPKIALLDTWSYFLKIKNGFESNAAKDFFGNSSHIAIAAIDKNIAEIEQIASNVLNEKDFKATKAFVEQYAISSPLSAQQQFQHKSIRADYLDFKNIPDSLAYQTVGSLSEVVADASNRFGYLSDATGKQLSWRTELMLREKGIDSLDVQQKFNEIEAQFERLLVIAENSPEELEKAIIEFRNNFSPFFESLNGEIRNSMEDISENINRVDDILLRERIVLDSIIKREREAITQKADELVETSIENAFDGLSKMVRNIIIYVILLILVLFGVPFYLGFLLGKKKSNP